MKQLSHRSRKETATQIANAFLVNAGPDRIGNLLATAEIDGFKTTSAQSVLCPINHVAKLAVAGMWLLGDIQHRFILVNQFVAADEYVIRSEKNILADIIQFDCGRKRST